MIHYYFGSKEGLYRAILEAAASKVRALLVDTSSRAGSTRDRLASFVDAYAEYILNHPNLARILYREMLTGGKHIMAGRSEVRGDNYTILRNTIAEGVESGELRQIDVELAPISLMGMVVIFQFLRPFISVALGKTEYDDRFVNRIAVHTIDLFLNGVRITPNPNTATLNRQKKNEAKHKTQLKGAIMTSDVFEKRSSLVCCF